MTIVTIGRAYYLLKEGRSLICKHRISEKEYTLLKTNYNSELLDVNDGLNNIQITFENIDIYVLPKVKEKKSKSNQVYLFEDINYLKIGKSNNPQKRLKEIKVGNPSVKFVASYESENADFEEKYLHDKFREFNTGGEWFFKDKSIFIHFGAKSKFPQVIQVFELQLSEKLWGYIETNKVSTYKLGHAVRLNGVCDIWYKNSTLFDINNNKYLHYSNEEELIKIVDNIIKNNEEKQPLKLTKTGKMSYQQYLNNKRQ